MTVVKDSNYMQQVIKQAVQIADETIAGVKAQIGTSGIGMGKADDAQLAAFMFKQQHLEPPAPYRLPDGRVVVVSPFILALGFCENGKEWIDRFSAFMSKHGGTTNAT